MFILRWSLTFDQYFVAIATVGRRLEARGVFSADQGEDDIDIEDEELDRVKEGFHKVKIITKEQAEASAAKATPENFAIFFEKYRAQKVQTDEKWTGIKCPYQPPAFQACNAGEQEDTKLLVCKAYQVVKYCSKYCYRMVR